jgi:hypothetical protein
MSVAQSIVRMSVLPQVFDLPSLRNLPRDQEPTVIRRSPPPRPLHLVVALLMRQCLKMYPPVIHTNREIVNYSKEDPMNVMHLCNKPCYNSSKERGIDERFWTFFHQDWYQIVLYLKSSLVVKQQYIDIEYMRNKKDMHFNRVLEACDLHEITALL